MLQGTSGGSPAAKTAIADPKSILSVVVTPQITEEMLKAHLQQHGHAHSLIGIVCLRHKSDDGPPNALMRFTSGVRSQAAVLASD